MMRSLTPFVHSSISAKRHLNKLKNIKASHKEHLILPSTRLMFESSDADLYLRFFEVMVKLRSSVVKKKICHYSRVTRSWLGEEIFVVFFISEKNFNWSFATNIQTVINLDFLRLILKISHKWIKSQHERKLCNMAGEDGCCLLIENMNQNP